ncbi:tRNA pseudouridine(38-40) synthase TruA [Butyrivibrio sp. NC3005]|uniref:tRNA pseudouridine(38-40) synthase TruA n=1 Tax=Butyrivibrio sp. NC3005 TaxID=1280685 RepID=UPI00040E846A|nr:tRNA pseudouridine(38-40) synthase TruA [Butyrivibrio sp. NC3005]
MKRNFKMVVRYDGTRYQGWEHQPGVEMTIEGKIETVLNRMIKDEIDNSKSEEREFVPVKVIASGRTDAGVHARGQVCNVHLDTQYSVDEIWEYMNNYLPDDIAIIELKEASDRFHARYNALGKTYVYTCYYGKSKPVFDRKYVTVLEQMPDLDKMREAAKYLEGTHDFKSFCSNPRMRKSTVRCVDTISIVQDGPRIRLTFHGNGFLQNMVRILVGTLLEVGFGRMTPERVKEVLELMDRKLAGPTAKPQGLCLMKVDY